MSVVRIPRVAIPRGKASLAERSRNHSAPSRGIEETRDRIGRGDGVAPNVSLGIVRSIAPRARTRSRRSPRRRSSSRRSRAAKARRNRIGRPRRIRVVLGEKLFPIEIDPRIGICDHPILIDKLVSERDPHLFKKVPRLVIRPDAVGSNNEENVWNSLIAVFSRRLLNPHRLPHHRRGERIRPNRITCVNIQH